MTLAFRTILGILALLAVAVAMFAGGCVLVLTNGAPSQLIGVWTVTLIAGAANLAFAYLALSRESRGVGIALIVVGLAYAIAANLVMWWTGNYDPKFGIGFVWPVFVVKGALACFTGYRVAWHPRQAGA